MDHKAKAPPYEVYFLSRTASEWLMMPARDRRIEGEYYLDRETRLMDGPTRERRATKEVTERRLDYREEANAA